VSPDLAAFLDVVLRGLALCGQAAVVGGVAFVLWVLRPAGTATEAGSEAESVNALRLRALALVAGAGLALAVIQATLLALHAASLTDATVPISQVMDTSYLRSGALRLVGALTAAGAAWALRSPSRIRMLPGLLGASCAVITLASAWISHAASRLEHRETLLMLDTGHQAGAAVWVGGLIHLSAAAFGRDHTPWPIAVIQRFSALAFGAVVLLLAAGLALTAFYVDGAGALLGTSYGIMVLTKGIVLLGLIALGALNFQAVRRLDRGTTVSLRRVRWFAEVEMGLGITVLFAAAALTSLPPSVDVQADRATLDEVLTRFTPRWPTFQTPAIRDMPVGDREAARTEADRAYSEYNHHVAGLFVATMGALALTHALHGRRWARHWPLLFLGLAAFIAVRADPGAWPLGPLGFWESLRYPEVVQHRAAAVLVVIFGVFEWMVRAERVRRRSFAYVFPLVCSVGGALLLTHSHALLDLRSEFLTEVTHAPLGVLALMMGWARWLELRLDAHEAGLPRRIWATAFLLVGALLLIYRER
jgi:copper resistance protein D